MYIDPERIRSHFANDRSASENGIVINYVTEDCAVCSMEIIGRHRNAAGGVQGGAVFTLADFAFAAHSSLALVCGEDIGVTVGQSCSISFLKSTRGSRLTAVSSCLSKGCSVSVYRICAEDDPGVRIAEMPANGFTSAKRTK